ncbi:MAG: helix-turn-helix transcriptional regulator [Rhodospirillales bacterium]|nr:helix-turn-helix transcriptional regulator [Rhodospirillales bacterium]
MPTIRTFKALANETRLQILQWLKDPERNFTAQEIGDFRTDGVCVKKIQEKAGLSQSTVSQYLSLLQKAGLVSAKRMGQWTYYRRDEKNIAAVVKGLRRSL